MVDTYFAECQDNKYGAGCSEDCGHCLNGEQCDHVNGTRRNGCEAGFRKTRCKRGWYKITMHSDTS